ncbi:unnamed protein product [Larinioides sclopetarius]|uniref:Integrase catalytic domain-containing protein n=1 Tax=Larinioides sclopetarius TaxID=280406 RepID=A0AAV1ZML5_9ARAC
MVSDNEQQFRCAEFAKFAEKWQFKHSTLSPYYGKTELAVKIVKNINKKSFKDKDDIWLSILNWRNTLTVNMSSSPVQRLISSRIISLLPTSDKLVRPQVQHFDVPDKITLKRKEDKKYYDRNSKQLPELEVGKEVFVRVPTTSKEDNKWKRGSIVGVHNSRSYDINTEDKTIRRNKNWLKQASNNDDGKNMKEESNEDTTQNTRQEEETSAIAEKKNERHNITAFLIIFHYFLFRSKILIMATENPLRQRSYDEYACLVGSHVSPKHIFIGSGVEGVVSGPILR